MTTVQELVQTLETQMVAQLAKDGKSVWVSVNRASMVRAIELSRKLLAVEQGL